jgi:hypothetical protein
MKKKILVPFLCCTIFLLIVSPIMAVQPTTETFTQVTVLVSYSIDPGKQFMTGNIVHVKGGISDVYQYGGPWEEDWISSQYTTKSAKFDFDTATGYSLAKSLDVYSSGVFEGTTNSKITGGGNYLYLGPTFTFTVGGRTETLTTGTEYAGALAEGFLVKHGVSGDLKGTLIEATYTGVLMHPLGPLPGIILMEITGNYQMIQ